MPVLTQRVSALAWNDEDHVQANRAAYAAKFAAVLPILSRSLEVTRPAAAFYLWPKTPFDDQQFAQDLFQQTNITVLPGSFLSRPGSDGEIPGKNHIRLALVAGLEECVEAAERICHFVDTQ